MNLYLVSRPENDEANYDEYDSFIVAAESEDEARKTHPSQSRNDKEWWKEDKNYDSWPTKPELVVVKLLGVANEGIKGLILSSFNAG